MPGNPTSCARSGFSFPNPPEKRTKLRGWVVQGNTDIRFGGLTAYFDERTPMPRETNGNLPARLARAVAFRVSVRGDQLAVPDAMLAERDGSGKSRSIHQRPSNWCFGLVWWIRRGFPCTFHKKKKFKSKAPRGSNNPKHHFEGG